MSRIVHLLVEASDEHALSRGVRTFEISFARRHHPREETRRESGRSGSCARSASNSTFHRFSCNARWEVENDSVHASVADAKARVPAQYRDVPIVWCAA